MPSLTDRARVLVATAYAVGDLDELRTLALSAIADYETAVRAYDALAADLRTYGVSA